MFSKMIDVCAFKKFIRDYPDVTMATKSVLLPPKDKQQFFCHSDSDSRYSELNLNQNYKCSKIFPIQSKSKSINENNKHFSNCNKQILDSFISDNQQKRKEPSLPWNKSTKSESLNLYNKIDEKQSQKQWKKDINSNANNKSTLSLHIKAYEKSVENSSNSNSNKSVKIVNKSLNFSSKFRYNFNYSDLEKALDETLISLGLEDDVLSEASTTIENPIIKSPKLNHSVQTPANRICNETQTNVGIDYEMCTETAAFEEQNVQEIFDHSITSEDPAFRDFLDKTHLTLGTDYEVASIAPTIENQSFQQTFNRSTNFEITTNSFFGGFNETEDILKNFDDDLDGDNFEESEKQPYIPPTFFHPKRSTTFNNNNNNSTFGETTNQNFGEYQTYQKRPPFEFFTLGGSVTVNTANTKPIPAFKGRCYSTSGHSISGRNVGDISFNETSETNASDTTFLSWGSRKSKCTKPPTGESSRAPYNFVPKVRNLTKIREDDIKSAKEYEKIYDFEEPLIVHGISDLVSIE
uniref:Uncharacterized protein n=1 Tax=Panagrolaimus davidi TaxID=227884 RepID=A0A914PXS9_9BILA